MPWPPPTASTGSLCVTCRKETPGRNEMTDQATQDPNEQDARDRLAELRAMPSWEEPEAYRGSIGRTMFDVPGAKDNTITVLLPTESLQLVPTQSLVRVKSHPDERHYLGI